MTRGLRFCAVDLHVHTPASKCFRGDVTAEQYVQQAISAGMQAVAITDHNTGDWVDKIKAAAADTPLTVFPGVEISVQPGIHILAIFPEDRTTAHVNDLLARLGLGTDSRGEQEALVTDFGAQKVVSMIRDEGALPILAHIDDHKGAWKELQNTGQTFVQLWEAAEFAAVEVVGDSLPEDVGHTPFTNIPAHYWSSDNPHPDDYTKHSHLGIGSRYSYFKLDETITWEGLRLCFHDPAVRIQSFSSDIVGQNTHPVVERVRVQGGFLKNLDLELNPNLNCVIGGRGTGKSTLLELLRHAFDIQPKTNANTKQAKSLIEHAFPPGSQITVDFWSGGTSYRLERSANQPPKVYRSDTSELLNVSPPLLLPLQAYGQKEIYEITQDPEFQLHLLDNYVSEAIQPLKERETEIVRMLERNATDILQKKKQIAAAEEKLDALGTVQEELRRMAELDFVARLESKSQLDKEKRLIARARSEVDDAIESLESFREEQRLDLQILDDDTIASLLNHPFLKHHNDLLNSVDAELQDSLTNLIARLQEIWAKGEQERLSWQKDYDAQETVYQEMLREFQDSGGSISPDTYIKLQNRLLQLQELQTETEAKRHTVEGLYEARRELLGELRQVRREQYELRCQKAAALTESLDGAVRITIHPQGNRDVYKDYLGQLCRGLSVYGSTQEQLVKVESKLPEQEAEKPVDYRGERRYLIPRIPRYLDPIGLAEAIRSEWDCEEGSKSTLDSQWDISSQAMRRNLAKLSEESLFELEIFNVPDLPVIELQVGSGLLGYKPLSALSVGQKCTALLGIVLLESPATLLVDQPEDDLDNQFIFDQIVDTLRREKERRQFIIATHNANIPVSGDAELIVVVEADENNGWVAENGVGSIDAKPIKQAVEQILEGGERAFQIRREKYGIA